jgi:cytoskeletal protein CcmA (bactofilin family)
MSFLGNSRHDLLKNTTAEPEATPRGSDARFLGEMPGAEPNASRSADRFTAPTTSDAPLAPDRCSNVIAAGARWKGSLRVEDSARIDGVFTGDIEAKGTVHVSEGAEVDAKIHAAFIVISGSFKGEIRADRMAELMPASRVTGEVMAKVLSVHEGAILDGAVQMTTTTEAPRTPAQPRGSSRNGALAEPNGEERRSRSEAATGAPNGA